MQSFPHPPRDFYMSDPLQGMNKETDLEILNQAFKSFNEATQQLQDSYDSLQTQVKSLEQELKNILESLTTGVIVIDKTGTTKYFNKTAGDITERDPQSCIGVPIEKVFEYDLFGNMVSRLAKNGDGPLSLDREINHPNGRKVAVQVSSSPLLDEDKNQVGTVLEVKDMTRFRELEEEAQRNKRMREMGEMAAGIAHEIRNPLASIELFASLLNKDLKKEPEKKQIVEHIRAGVKNMDRIISSLLLFAQSPRPSRQKCNLNQLLGELLNGDPGVPIPSNIKINSRFHSETPPANGDGELLKQVFLNLIRNGIQAMPEGGELSVTTQINDSSHSASNRTDHRRFINITVADTGQGIQDDHRMKVFNPFFSTKDKGTGLGLAISHNIIKAHQGTIDVTSQEGQGTTFIVKIPCWDNEFDRE